MLLFDSLDDFIGMENKIHKKGIFIGQAPPEKEYKIPFARTRLYSWFESIDIQKDFILKSFEFEALVNKFPGKTNNKHNLPLDVNIQSHIPTLVDRIQKLEINLIVPIGKLAIQHVLNDNHVSLNDVVGKKIIAKPFGKMSELKAIIPLPHPSGLSTWVFNSENKLLLQEALLLIKEELI